jgi:hypothetical protein
MWMVKALAASSVALSCAATAAPTTGNDLLKWHQGRVAGARDPYLSAYVNGVVDSEHDYFTIYSKYAPKPKVGMFSSIPADVDIRLPFCMPDEATYGQAYDVVIKFLEANPSTRHYSGLSIIRIALWKSWPCPDK